MHCSSTLSRDNSRLARFSGLPAIAQTESLWWSMDGYASSAAVAVASLSSIQVSQVTLWGRSRSSPAADIRRLRSPPNQRDAFFYPKPLSDGRSPWIQQSHSFSWNDSLRESRIWWREWIVSP